MSENGNKVIQTWFPVIALIAMLILTIVNLVGRSSETQVAGLNDRIVKLENTASTNATNIAAIQATIAAIQATTVTNYSNIPLRLDRIENKSDQHMGTR